MGESMKNKHGITFQLSRKFRTVAVCLAVCHPEYRAANLLPRSFVAWHKLRRDAVARVVVTSWWTFLRN
jgi:hypothetical protein